MKLYLDLDNYDYQPERYKYLSLIHICQRKII